MFPGQSGGNHLAVSTMLGEFRQRQQTGSFGWRTGVAPTTKPGKTLMFTEKCQNIDTLKQPGVTESLAIVTPEVKQYKALAETAGKTVHVTS